MKTFLVTGSSSGIGRAVTLHLLKQQHGVIGLSRNHHKFDPMNANYQPIPIDFAQTELLESQYKHLRKNLPQLSGVICCAGYGKFLELEQFSSADMQKLMHVNFMSQALLIKMLLSDLKKKHPVHIILLGSECALTGRKKATMYAASKFALRGFAQSLRQECRQANLAVTLINPGLVDTPFYDELSFLPGSDPGQSISAEQVADAIIMTLSMDVNCVVEEINLQPRVSVIKKR